MPISSFTFAGQFLLESSRYDEAAAEYERAAELTPDDVDAVLNAANALRQAGINDRAESYYRRAVQLQPTVSSLISLPLSYLSLL
jgi:Flp pilus assembly protein TadD